VGLQTIWKPWSRVTWVQNYMVGAEQNNNAVDKRHLWDTVLTYTVNSKWSLTANYDYGMDRAAGARVRWQGVAAYARYAVNNWLALTPRFEWLDDPQGFTTGAVQTLREFTFTGEFNVHKSLLIRTEFRRDFSNNNVFERKDGSFGRSQTTATIGLIFLPGREN